MSPKTKKSLALRKSPMQPRSRETVELIITTAAGLLEQQGYEKFSTAAVAKRTGVSIGTLYQYYPNKESLIAAIIERRSQDELALLTQTMVEFKNEKFTTIFTEMTRRHLAFHRERPDLQRIIVEEIPKAGKIDRLHEMETSAIRSLARFLREHQSAIAVQDFEMAAFNIFYAFKWLARTAITSRPEYLDDPQFEVEINRLLTGYLKP